MALTTDAAGNITASGDPCYDSSGDSATTETAGPNMLTAGKTAVADTTDTMSSTGEADISGDTLNTATDDHVDLVAVRVVPGAADMYNLTVDQLHTYYVLAGTTPVLVHNACPAAADISAHDRASETDARSFNPGNSTSPKGATGGYLWIKGHGVFDLVSSKPYAGYRPPPGVISDFETHVEAQAAALMWRFGAKEARMMISHPRGACLVCASSLRAMLPTGASLTVRFQRGGQFHTSGNFVGD